ncbi:hypothetical protein HU200_020242 [Digitaria exilis]|uniref:Uncharacterized protein n=1 Tax=Digitaria exilis TaxID=1010633 RepID=A0A835F1N5_9POAL|nr:hypothetical protein HU200_020242 [Digitaria exilis]
MAAGHKGNKTTATPAATVTMLVLLLLLSSTVSEAGRQLPGHELKWEPLIVYPIWQPPIVYPGIPPEMSRDLPSADEWVPTALPEEDPGNHFPLT